MGCRRAGNAAVAVLVVTAGFAIVWVLALPWLAANLVLLELPSSMAGLAPSRHERGRLDVQPPSIAVAVRSG